MDGHPFRKKAATFIQQKKREKEEKTFAKFQNDGRFVRQEVMEKTVDLLVFFFPHVAQRLTLL